MASAEHLLHEAQYAFNSITYGESRANRRNAARASKLCNKIIRRHPGTTEAYVAHAILRRLGEEAFMPKLAARHRHIPESEHHKSPRRATKATTSATTAKSAVPPEMRTFVTHSATDDVSLDWGGLVSAIFMAPKIVLGLFAGAGMFLFGIFGWFVLVPLLLAALVLGPGRPLMNRQQRDQVNMFIATANSWIAEKQNLRS